MIRAVVAALVLAATALPAFAVELRVLSAGAVEPGIRPALAAFERASGRPVPCEIVARRPGDVDACYADPSRASRLLNWEARRDLDAMCADSWRWQKMNPDGYSSAGPA